MGNSQNPSTKSSGKAYSKGNSKMNLYIRSATWTRESHGLFDYESKTLIRKTIKTSFPGKIVRASNDVHLVKENGAQDDNGRMPTSNNIPPEKELARIAFKEGDFWIQELTEKPKESQEAETKPAEDGLWMVVKSLKANNPNKGYKLEEGEIIKLGRVKFQVKEMRGGLGATNTKKSITKQEDDQSPTKIISDDQTKKKTSVLTGKEKAQNDANKSQSQILSCRICLSEDAESDNPFVSPCHCTGTMKLVHIKCLQQWLRSKLHTKETGSAISYYWKSFECELCKFAYPNNFALDGKKYDLIDIPRPDSAYLMLEMLSKDQKSSRGVHVINMATKTNIRLGRGHDSDIRITDISVSRYHGIIKLEKGNFYLEDNSSKFGTLVQINGALKIAQDARDVSVQIGRTLLNFTIQKNKSKFMSCFRASNNSDGEDNGVEEIVHGNYGPNEEFVPEAGEPQNSYPEDPIDGLQVAEENLNHPEIISNVNVNIQLSNNPSNVANNAQ